MSAHDSSVQNGDNSVNSVDRSVRDDGRVSPHALRSNGRAGANIAGGGIDISGRGRTVLVVELATPVVVPT